MTMAAESEGGAPRTWEVALTAEEIELAASSLEFSSTYALQPDLAADALAKKFRAASSAGPGGRE